MNAYSTPERTAAFMDHISKNHDKIMKLRNDMRNPGHSMAEKTLAFIELYRLQHGDPHAQRRLITELEYEAKRDQHS